MSKGFAIALAWPDTKCKQAGAWYDYFMYITGINKSGYYKVGHAALVLVDTHGNCEYFDFGRYHAPKGFGRVRSAITDHDLIIKTRARIDWQKIEITNIMEILGELAKNESCHGDGAIHGKETMVDYSKTRELINSMQAEVFIRYGPFVSKGTNCSRFVNKVIRSGCFSLWSKLLLKFPLTISPTPMWNLTALGRIKHIIEQFDIIKLGGNQSKIYQKLRKTA